MELLFCLKDNTFPFTAQTVYQIPEFATVSRVLVYYDGLYAQSEREWVGTMYNQWNNSWQMNGIL